MAENECYLCKKQFGRFSFTYHRKDVISLRLPLPEGMRKDGKICEICIEKMKREREEEENKPKPQFRDRINHLIELAPEYKKEWDRYGIIQFKNERMAILQRIWGRQVEFIVAFDELLKEGYQLVAIDEERQPSSGEISKGANSYFYFQKIK